MSEAKNTALGTAVDFGYSGRSQPPGENENHNRSPARRVTRYLEAANRFDATAAAECFTADATVHDENHDYAGRDAIWGWIAETSRKYHPAFTLMRASVHGDNAELAVAISGQFPGSPITLDYTLQFHDGKILNLTIE